MVRYDPEVHRSDALSALTLMISVARTTNSILDAELRESLMNQLEDVSPFRELRDLTRSLVKSKWKP